MSEDIKKKRKKKKRKSSEGFAGKNRESAFAFRDTGLLKRLVIVVALIMIAVTAVVVINDKYTIDTVVVEGSTHYTNEEIIEKVIGDGFLSHSSIYLSVKYRDREINDIPFIETLNVRIMSPDTIKITVYEKAIAGFVEEMGRYIYFDKDGTVIESSNVKTAGIPQIMGMEFDHFVLYEKLPVTDDKIFKQILEVSQLLDKYGISVDRIYFDKDYNLTLYFDEARVKLGSFDQIDEKIIRLKTILPELKGKKGVLRMENYTADTAITTFEYDD